MTGSKVTIFVDDGLSFEEVTDRHPRQAAADVRKWLRDWGCVEHNKDGLITIVPAANIAFIEVSKIDDTRG